MKTRIWFWKKLCHFSNSNVVFIVLKSDILVAPLDCALYHWRLINAIVHKIAIIVITTCILKKEKTLILYNIVFS